MATRPAAASVALGRDHDVRHRVRGDAHRSPRVIITGRRALHDPRAVRDRVDPAWSRNGDGRGAHERPISRATKLAIACALPLQAICVATPFLVRGPLELHRDIFGDAYYGAHTGWMVLFVLPIAALSMILIRSRVAAMPEALTRLRRGFRSGVLVFALAGLHDSLVGAGVFHSMFLLEYAFVAFGIIAANFDLRRAAIIANEMETRLADKRRALDDQESRLERAEQRVDRSTTRYRHLADARTKASCCVRARGSSTSISRCARCCRAARSSCARPTRGARSSRHSSPMRTARRWRG